MRQYAKSGKILHMTNTSDRIQAAVKLLDADITLEKFENIKTLLSGINPKLDKILQNCSQTISTLENIKEGDVISLTAENLPDSTEQEKKRKRAILFFIKNYKTLKSEIERVQSQFKEKGQNTQSLAKLFSSAKGPFGIITIVAVVAVGAYLFFTKNNSTNITNEAANKISVIDYSGKKIPLTELTLRTGPDCKSEGEEVAHYHAKSNQSARATDGTTIPDLGSCAYGKASEVKVLEVEVAKN